MKRSEPLADPKLSARGRPLWRTCVAASTANARWNVARSSDFGIFSAHLRHLRILCGRKYLRTILSRRGNNALSQRPAQNAPSNVRTAAPPAFPLKASANNRYLVDQNNVPFLMVGDAPQTLIANLSQSRSRGIHGQPTELWHQHACGSTFSAITPMAAIKKMPRPLMASPPLFWRGDLSHAEPCVFPACG